MVDLEDDSTSTREFARNMSKCSDPRLAWMERTLSKVVRFHSKTACCSTLCQCVLSRQVSYFDVSVFS